MWLDDLTGVTMGYVFSYNYTYELAALFEKIGGVTCINHTKNDNLIAVLYSISTVCLPSKTCQSKLGSNNPGPSIYYMK
jgi:hypothetical protein